MCFFYLYSSDVTSEKKMDIVIDKTTDFFFSSIGKKNDEIKLSVMQSIKETKSDIEKNI